ncbi:hydrolase TatD [Candidatus Falkowbacteria bacterium HGW-Falkowbacteria-1]|jgi:TatD DNase family protein|uniref:Hydrolase TatD n=1 Tax=Candidatus Falkowbacteria bacterium HGW-Falkowbacteria-1 TaxID=2013768 RepID=A0A2N2EAM8_9BACT|nr:MAG: hydrolase TatD [Candidatus Falkowbacteria bacterium HGW-Falkowbacteria-1]
MFIDTHCHLNFKDFKDDYYQVAKRALDDQVEMIVVGSEVKTSQRAVDLLDEFGKGVYAAVGLHPIHLQDILVKNNNENGKYEFRSKKEDYSEEDYFNLAKSNKRVVAIGEIGLDYYHIGSDVDSEIKKIKNLQQEVFYRQLELSKKLDLPAIVHCREAHDDLFPILQDFYKRNSFKKEWGVIHCFSGDYDLAKKYFEIGLKISFTGLVTFVKDWDEVIKKSPLQKIMIETDSPYLSPEPHRGKRNEPIYVKEVAKKIANIKALDFFTVENELYQQSKTFFSL